MLASRTVIAAGSAPRRSAAILHGILGRGRNWATFASALVARRPDWAVELVDLRLHGASTGFAPPHDMAHAAADVTAWMASRARPVEALIGHSFGGKAALLAARPPVARVIVVDASPSSGAPSGQSLALLARVRELPFSFASREELIERLAGTVDETTARWMATNLTREEGRYTWALDVEGAGSMLEDYFRVDAWPVLDNRAGPAVTVVRAIGSPAIPPEDAARVAALAARDPRITLVELAGGHWLHVDSPAALLDAVAGAL